MPCSRRCGGGGAHARGCKPLGRGPQQDQEGGSGRGLALSEGSLLPLSHLDARHSLVWCVTLQLHPDGLCLSPEEGAPVRLRSPCRSRGLQHNRLWHLLGHSPQAVQLQRRVHLVPSCILRTIGGRCVLRCSSWLLALHLVLYGPEHIRGNGQQPGESSQEGERLPLGPRGCCVDQRRPLYLRSSLHARSPAPFSFACAMPCGQGDQGRGWLRQRRGDLRQRDQADKHLQQHLDRTQHAVPQVPAAIRAKGSPGRTLLVHGSHRTLRKPDVRASQPLGNRAVGLSTKPLHQAGSPEEDAHLHRLPACSTAGSLCFWFHPLALHQDDLPCCSCSVPPSQAPPSSSTAGTEIPRSHRPNYKGLIHHVQSKNS